MIQRKHYAKDYLCQSCKFFEYFYLDEDNLLSGGCGTNVAFPAQMRKKKCGKYKLLSKEENNKRCKDRLNKIDGIRFRHEGTNRVYRLSINQIWRLQDYILEYLFHRDLFKIQNIIQKEA